MAMFVMDEMESENTKVNVAAFASGFFLLPVMAGIVVAFALVVRDIYMPFSVFLVLTAALTAVLAGIAYLAVYIPTLVERYTVAEHEALFRCSCGEKKKFSGSDASMNLKAANNVQMRHAYECELSSSITYYR
jgi:hypothetical protein